MTDERDPQVSGHYRALGAEEPSRALDEAVLAAARRAVETHPAPLVAPTGRRAWFVPLAAAAVLLLAVGVVLHMQLEQPDLDGMRQESRAPRPAPAVPVAPAQAPAAQAARIEPKPVTVSKPQSAAAPAPTPEKELERIAAMRAAGRHEEADKALAEFRKRHPDYRIPEAMLERIERR